MKTSLIIIILVLLQHLSMGQNLNPWDSKIDSLKNLLESTSTDSIQVQIANNLANLLSNKAWNLTNNGDLAIAYTSYSETFEFWENPEMELLFKNDDKLYWSMLANINFNYGHLMGATGNVAERKIYYQKAYQISNKWDDVLNTVYSLTGMAYIHIGVDEIDSARIKIEKALTYPPQLYNYDSYGIVLFIEGEIKLELEEFENAKESFLNGSIIATQQNISFDLALNNYGLSRAYRQLGIPDSSYLYGLKALDFFIESREIRFFDIDLAKAYENVYEHFQYFEQPDSAFKYLQLAQLEREILTKKQRTNMAAFQQLLLERERKLSKQEKENIETSNRLRTYTLLFGLGVFAIIVFLLYRNNRQKRNANLVLEEALFNLKATQSKLIHSEKMASLGELTAGIAHEIQNPLNFVNNFSEVSTELIDEMNEEIEEGNMEDVKEIASDLKQNLEKINHHGQRAGDIVKGMLQHSRTSSGVKEPTDINALADEYLRLAYHGLRAKDKSFNAEFTTDLDSTLPEIKVVPQDIGRVLLNLINNAFQASSTRSANRSEEVGSDYKPKIEVSTKLLKDKIEIKVTDNGTGIPDDIKDKIFQPFFTTKPTGQGTGLGLSLSYDIVKAHGGELKVETKEGEGTAFLIYLHINNR